MDVKLSIKVEDAGMNNSVEEVKKDDGHFQEESEVEMGSLKEEIWRTRQDRMKSALATVRTTAQQDPPVVYAAVRRLAGIINSAGVDEFISEVEELAKKTDPSAILNFLTPSGSSLLHVAAQAGKDDILRLLVDYVHYHLIAAQDDWGDTPLHMAAKAGGFRATVKLIRRARDHPSIKNILRIQNRHGNTALHEAVICGRVDVVHHLLREDLEPVYWKNAEKKSPLYLALDTSDSVIQEVLFSLPLEPSRIQGLPPIHGAILREHYGTYLHLLVLNICVRTDLLSNLCDNFLRLPKLPVTNVHINFPTPLSETVGSPKLPFNSFNNKHHFAQTHVL